MMVAFFQRHISAWMDGTESLPDGEYRAYDVVCNLIYLNDGPIVINERGFAGRCNQHLLAFRRHLQSLFTKKKLVVTSDGKVSNRRVEAELKKISAKRKPGSDPRPTPQQPPSNPRRTPDEPPRGQPSKLLKNVELDLGLSALDKRIEEKNPVAYATGDGADPVDQRTKLFREGLDILVRITGRGQDGCRKVIGAWLRDAADDAVLVNRCIEDAERERVGYPLSWIKQAISVRSKRGGFYEANQQRPTGGSTGQTFATRALARARPVGDEGS